MQARSLYVLAPKKVEWIAEELPELGVHEVLVQTTTGESSIGSELPRYSGTARSSSLPKYPVMTGYENVGTVLARGSEVKRVHPGVQVVCFYGHRTHAVIPESKVIRVPDEISDELALLTILTCDCAKGVRKVMPRPEEAVLVSAAGAIGLMTLFILRAYGVLHVDVVEMEPQRHELARKLGARRVLLPNELPESSETYTVSFECTSRNAAFALLQWNLKPEGRLCVLADGNYEPLQLTPAFHEKELSLFASSDGWNYQEHAAWFFQVAGQSGLEALFEWRVSAQELPDVFERLVQGEMRPVKVLVSYEPQRASGR
ncbi:alcohol dehydrogenase [Thermosporothrix hazakensis]|uniref:Alcohol dehydrogenase n=2 Tax=Thermosporothrix TaxID=768650 RepID=A0A326UEB9_THEHA|nr:zinc-binding alcohol dehydrogenase [Thermosporothrix hazakensis]PZW36265.1 alcohol dehydrogenase [Thermosporothrix hazakensis]BBH88729.1 alcohol dehydrogenase [Thermosporothrix sp. COM3]GCE46914.1 alcohol dehydrogenase [Thermosporothrix hazakensis]